MTTTNVIQNEETRRVSIDEAIDRLGMGHFQDRIFLAAGLCFAADAMEVLLLSFLSVVLQAQWGLSEEEAATITSVVFLGALVGTLCLGVAGDLFGRKPIFCFTATMICVFGFATAAANNFWQLALCRFLVGFGVGGSVVPFDTLAEFVPTSHRGHNLLSVEYYWVAGTLLVPVVAVLTLGQADNEQEHNNEWRTFVTICAIPCLVALVVSICYVPESPRWMLSKGNQAEALQVLREAARLNDKDPDETFPPGTLLIQDERHVKTNNFVDLFKPDLRHVTILLWVSWAAMAFTYYGTIIVVTLVFASGEQDEIEGMYSFDYSAILASASSEIVGTAIAILCIDRVGRIPMQGACYVGGGVSIFLLCTMTRREDVGDGVEQRASRALLIVLAFLARMFFYIASCTLWVSTAEMLPQQVRSTGHAAANAIARLGGAMSPYLVSSEIPLLLVGSVIMTAAFLAASASWKLPETNGTRLGLDTRQRKSANLAKEAEMTPQAGYDALD